MMQQAFTSDQTQRPTRWWLRTFYISCVTLAMLMLLVPRPNASEPHIAHLEVQDAIGPATTDYLSRSLQRAQQQGAQVAVIELDTPGGLLSSTRDIVRLLLQSEIPVVTYVSPEGARAASAGTFIAYASHVIAMHPSTNLGAATPIQMQGQTEFALGTALTETEQEPPADNDDATGNDDSEPARGSSAIERKVTNDAVSLIKNLAERHGRNAEWAELAVREAETLTAREALEANVIELVVSNMQELVASLDGRTVVMETGDLTLQTEGLSVVEYGADFRNRVLSLLTNPQLAYLLLLVGIYGIIFELMSPGALFPGITGVISLLLAAFSLQILPINVVGLLLIIAGAIMLLVEFFVPSFGIIGVGGVIALTAGSLMLFDSSIPGMELPMSIIMSVAAVALASVLFVVFVMARSSMRTRKPSDRDVIGLEGKVVENLNPEGLIQLGNEIWPAHAQKPRLITHGRLVRVVAQEGTLAYVEEIKKTEQRPAQSSWRRK